MLYNLQQIRQFVATNLGIQNSSNPPIYDFDNSTPVPLSQVNNFINDEIREDTSAWDYTFLEDTKSINFWNVVSGVQGVALAGIVSGINVYGTIAPYPAQQLSYSWRADNSVTNVSNNFSGIVFNGVSASGIAFNNVVSTSGSATYNNTISGVTNIFQLDPDVAKIEGLFMQSSANGNTGYGIPLNELTYHDFLIKYPIGVVNISGTPYEYAKFPGLGPNNDPVLTLAPFPTPDFSGNSLVLHYLKKHVDLVNDTDIQRVIPQQFQQIIIEGVCEKITAHYAQDDPRTDKYARRKENLTIDMKQWDFNQANLTRAWKLGPRNGPYGIGYRSPYDTSTNIYVP